MKLTIKLDSVIVISTLIAGLSILTLQGLNGDPQIRVPSSESDEAYELHLQSLALGEMSQLKAQENVYLRATFAGSKVYEIGRKRQISLNPGDKIALDYKIEIQNSWIKSDQVEFKLELVKDNFMKSTLVRCAQVAKDLSAYNRAYQCFIPGDEDTPLLSYRLAKKGAPLPAKTPIASR